MHKKSKIEKSTLATAFEKQQQKRIMQRCAHLFPPDSTLWLIKNVEGTAVCNLNNKLQRSSAMQTALKMCAMYTDTNGEFNPIANKIEVQNGVAEAIDYEQIICILLSRMRSMKDLLDSVEDERKKCQDMLNVYKHEMLMNNVYIKYLEHEVDNPQPKKKRRASM